VVSASASRRGVWPITTILLPDEWGYLLYEIDEPSPDGRGKHRWQVVRVARNDAPAEHWTDLGLSASFKANQFEILGGVVDKATGRAIPCNTVAELQDIADWMRGEKPKQVEPTDLQGLWRNYVEERHRRRRHQSTFGTYGRVERR